MPSRDLSGPPPARPAMHNDPRSAPPDPDFVGRDRELARLLDLLDAARRPEGQACAAMVTGPAGVGKSRLLQAFKRCVRHAQAPVLEGRCRATDTRPHGPLLDLLGATAGLLSDLGRSAPRTERALGLIAGLGTAQVSDALRLGPPERGDQQLAFFEAVRLALIEAASVLPPVLILHDLHHADATTVATLRYLLDNLLADPAFDTPADSRSGAAALDGIEAPRFRGLLLLSFRPTEGTRTLVDLSRQGAAVEHVPLGPLDAVGVRAWLDRERVVAQVLAASGGLPATLDQLFDALPADPDQAWQRRFEHLTAAERALLDVLAVYDRPLGLAQAASLSGLGEAVQAAVSRLLSIGLVERLLDRGRFALRVRGSAAREAYLARMGEAQRAHIHRAIAAQWAQAGAMGADPAEIARHHLAADDALAATPYAIAAAGRAFDAFAFLRAADLLGAISPAVAGADRQRVLDRLASALAHAGRHTEARAVLAELSADAPQGTAAQVVLAARQAQQALLDGDPAGARALAEAALGMAPDDSGNDSTNESQPDDLKKISPSVGLALGEALSLDLRMEVWALAAEGAYGEGAYDRALTLAEAGLAHHDAGAAALTLRNTAGKVRLVREQLDEAQAVFAQNLGVATAGGFFEHEARALINLGVVHLQRGETDAALGQFEAARRRCRETDNLRLLAIAVENLAVLHHRRHDHARAIDCYQQSSAAARQLGQRGHVATSALNLADLYLTVGDAERGRRLSAIARGIIRGHRLRWLEAQLLALEGELSRSEGDLEGAAEQLQAALGLHERGEGSNQRLAPLLRGLAELNIELGRLDTAEGLLDRALALPAAQTEAVAAQLRMVRGALQLARQAPEAARANLEATAALAEDLGDPELLWQALARLAEAHWASGHRADTLQSLAAAVDAFERVGARLPEHLRPGYFAAPRRRRVRDALRRVRAGLGPFGSGRTDDQETRPRAGSHRAVWGRRYPEIIGRASALLPVFNALDRVAGSDSQVLIRGESGTGKELVAAALHAHSPRAPHAFVKVNCAAFVESLLLSELFGHERGAFTGAVAGKKGRFELAHRGTLFLDEIGDISPNTQVALLRVLQEGTFERVGGQESLKVDVRVVCATHRNLEEMVQRGTFRADLYYRLRGVIIDVPALRERRADIPLLVEHFLDRRPNAAVRPLRFTRPALASLLQHDWPGNVRELENVIRSVALFTDGQTIGLAELAELGDLFHPPDEQALLDLSDLLTQTPELAGIAVLPTVAPPRPPRPGPAPGAAASPDEVPATPSPHVPAAVARASRPTAGIAPQDAHDLDDDEPEDAGDGGALADAHDDEGGDEGGDEDGDENEAAEGGGQSRGVPGYGGESALNDDWLAAMLDEEGSLSNLKRRIEYEAIARALSQSEGNITRAAEKLGMKRPRLSQIIHADPSLGDLKKRVDKR